MSTFCIIFVVVFLKVFAALLKINGDKINKNCKHLSEYGKNNT